MSGRKNRGAGKTILLMLYVLLFLSGLSLLLYPKLNAIWIDYMLHRDAAEFLSFVYLYPKGGYIPCDHSESGANRAGGNTPG